MHLKLPLWVLQKSNKLSQITQMSITKALFFSGEPCITLQKSFSFSERPLNLTSFKSYYPPKDFRGTIVLERTTEGF